MPVLFGGNNLPPLVLVGLTDLPKSGGAMPPRPPPPETTPLENAFRGMGMATFCCSWDFSLARTNETWMISFDAGAIFLQPGLLFQGLTIYLNRLKLMSRVRRKTIQAMCGTHLATEPLEGLKI